MRRVSRWILWWLIAVDGRLGERGEDRAELKPCWSMMEGRSRSSRRTIGEDGSKDDESGKLANGRVYRRWEGQAYGLAAR